MAIRPLGPGDETCVARLLCRMSNESLYFRFFTVPSDSHLRAEIERLTRPASSRHAALGAETAGELVGVASFECDDETGGSAELAILVDDSCQGRGIGRRLLQRLVEVACEQQVPELRASVLATNVRMLRLARSMAASATFQPAGGVIDVTVPVQNRMTDGSKPGRRADSMAVGAMLSGRSAHARCAPYSTTLSAPVSAGRAKTS